MVAIVPDLPQWANKDALVIHVPSGEIFIAARCQRDRRDRTMYLIRADGQEYALSECRQPTEIDFETPAQIWVGDIPIQITIQSETLYVLSDGEKRIGVRVDPLVAIAQNFAKAFGGVVVEVADDADGT